MLPDQGWIPARACGPSSPPRGGAVPDASPGCHDHPMASSSAELSSLATALDDLSRRITVHADAADAAKDEETARELFAIERALNSANRRLARLSLTLSRR